MLTCNGIRRHIEGGWAKDPIRIGKIVDKPEVLEFAITGFKAIPLRFFYLDSHLAAGIAAPAACRYQQSFKQAGTLALLRTHQEARVEYPWSCLVIQITLILVEVTNHTQTAIAELKARCDGVVAVILSGLDWRRGG